jgi:hypothetical protein
MAEFLDHGWEKMPRNEKTVLEEKLRLKKAQLLRIDEMKSEGLRESRALLLRCFDSGMSQTYLARLWKTSPTRMKNLLAQAEAERSTK